VCPLCGWFAVLNCRPALPCWWFEWSALPRKSHDAGLATCLGFSHCLLRAHVYSYFYIIISLFWYACTSFLQLAELASKCGARCKPVWNLVHDQGVPFNFCRRGVNFLSFVVSRLLREVCTYMVLYATNMHSAWESS